MKKSFIISIGVAMLFFFVFSTAGFGAQAKKTAPAAKAASDKNILVRVGTKSMTKAELEARIASLPPQYQEALKKPEARRNFLNVYVQAQLFAYGAKEEKIDKDRAVAMQIDDSASSILAQEFVRRKLAGIGKATEEEIKKYYEENKTQLVNPTTVKVQHILIRAGEGAKPEELAEAVKKAENVKKQLDAGGDFDKLAKEYSEDTGTKEKGGDLGYFAEHQMVPEFSEPVFKMKVGEISAPIKSPFGYHVVKLNDRKEGSSMDIKEATPIIESTLMKMKQQKALEKEIDRLKKKYKVVINEDAI